MILVHCMQMSGILIKSSIVQAPLLLHSSQHSPKRGAGEKGRATAIPAGAGTSSESGKPQLISKEEA